MLSATEIVVLLFITAASAVTFHHCFLLRNGPLEPPLVKGPWPILGCAFYLQRDFKSFLLKYRAKYGGIFTIYVAGQRFHIISDPIDGIPTYFRSRNFGFKDFSETMRRKQFLNTPDEINDNAMSQQLQASLGPGLLSIEATNELTDRLILHLPSTMEWMMRSLGEGWQQVDLIEWCSKVVFELSNFAVMGSTFPRDEQMYKDLIQFEDNLMTVWKMPELFLKKEQALARRLLARTKQYYERGMEACSVVSMRCQIAEEHGKHSYPPKDILTIGWASLTNAMPTLFWYLVYIHLTSQQGIFLSEIMNYSTPGSSNEINTSDTDFDKLLTSDLLNSGLKETLRLQAHNLSPRKMDEDTILKVEGKDYLLRKGTMAFAPSTLINWNPDIYEHPAEWKADRFVEKDVREESFSEHEHHTKKDVKKLKFALPIWGGGIHMCPGRRFATHEVIIMLTTILRYFEIAPLEEHFQVPGEPAKDQYGLGVKPPTQKYMVRMRVRK